MIKSCILNKYDNIDISEASWRKQLFHVKKVCKNVKNQNVLNCTDELFIEYYRVATLSTFSLTVSGIIIPSLKDIGQFL